MKKMVSIGILSIALILIGCGSDNDSSSSTNSNSTNKDYGNRSINSQKITKGAGYNPSRKDCYYRWLDYSMGNPMVQTLSKQELKDGH